MMRAMLRHPLQFMADHRFTLAHASEFLDGDLDAPQQSRVERHAHLCPKCAELLASLRGTVTALAGLRQARSRPDTDDVAGGVIARLRADDIDDDAPP